MKKTTVELPDALLTAAKKRAADLGRPLRALIETGLRAQLAGSRVRARGRRAIRWVTVDGGLPRGLDVASRTAMHAGLRRLV